VKITILIVFTLATLVLAFSSDDGMASCQLEHSHDECAHALQH
jgi:hypothetical protein